MPDSYSVAHPASIPVEALPRTGAIVQSEVELGQHRAVDLVLSNSMVLPTGEPLNGHLAAVTDLHV